MCRFNLLLKPSSRNGTQIQSANEGIGRIPDLRGHELFPFFQNRVRETVRRFNLLLNPSSRNGAQIQLAFKIEFEKECIDSICNEGIGRIPDLRGHELFPFFQNRVRETVRRFNLL